MCDITKTFGDVVANNCVNLNIKPGEIHALLGENGAGKSTLMNVLYGLYSCDQGEIFIEGQCKKIKSPDEAIGCGIGMVHQHFMLIPVLSVIDNIILGQKDNKFVLERDKAAKKIKELGEKYNLAVDPEAKIKDLTVGQKQRVEIVKSLYCGANILIMDEPTAVLTPQETKFLFNIIKGMTDKGFTVIFISHKLNEVMEISDRVTVLREGKVVGTVETENTNKDELAKMMVGREVLFDVDLPNTEIGEKVLNISDLIVKDNKEDFNVINGLNLEVRSGEILGLAGVDGNAQTELVEAITGLKEVNSGEISLKDQVINNYSPKERIEVGISHIPEDRHERGLILDLTLKENLITAEFDKEPFSKKGFINWKVVRKHADKMVSDYNIKTSSINAAVNNLSGGNQQKVILARELNRKPELLVAMHPTRGLDVGAIEYVYQKIADAKSQDAAVLLISTELEEIFKLSDKIAVIYEGEILKVINKDKASYKEIGLLMAGSKS
ncbi:MAG: ABC transporter ATP-binding protein [Halanaerobiales bacterium]